MTDTCSVDGCIKPRLARDWCGMHYARWRRTGDTRGSQLSAIDRFMSHVRADPANQCWLWTSSITRWGYGRFSMGRLDGHIAAHRWAYEYYRAEIPDGLDLDHLCRVRACVNPWHLEPVTRAINLKRGVRTEHQSLKTHCPHGHPYDEANTLRSGGGRHCRACMRVRAAARRARERAAR